MQEPVADECSHYADCRVADETETLPLNNLARQPSSDDPDDQNYKQPLVRQMHALPLVGRLDSRPNCDIAQKTGLKTNAPLAHGVIARNGVRVQGQAVPRRQDRAQAE